MTRERKILAAGGAYGLTVTGLGDSDLLVRLPPAHPWPELGVALVPKESDAWMEVGARRATFRFLDGSHVLLHRENRSALIFAVPGADPEMLVEAALAAAGTVFARWSGRESFHAGGFVSRGEAWALVGDRQTGKSSLLALLARRGFPVLTDDLMILAGERALAGPRAVDLRPESAAELSIEGIATRVRGTDPRWRLGLPQVEPEVPLGGWVFLAWGPRLAVRGLDANERVRRLLRNRMLSQPRTHPVKLLELAQLPAWELARPRHWSSMPGAVELLLEAVGN